MSFFERFRDRHNVVILVVALALIGLSFRMAKLTIVDGEEYRRLAETRKFKEIPITAPRGEIRDRNGKLLAGNKPSFTVQVVKDEIESTDAEGRNKTLLNLIHILGDEGISYKDELPILMNDLKYRDGSLNSESGNSPIEEVAERIVSGNLIPTILNLSMEYSESAGVSDFYMAKKALNILESESGGTIPIDINTEGGVEFYYTQEDVSDWKSESGLSGGVDAKTAVIQLIESKNLKQFAIKLINDPISREIAYDYLSSIGLLDDIEMEKFSLKYDDEYKSIKEELSAEFQSVSMDSKAKDDFVNILRETNGIQDLLESVFVERVDGEKEYLNAPGEKLIDMLEDKGTDIPFKVEIDEENKTLKYEVKNEKKKSALYKEYDIDSKTAPANALLKIAEKENIILDFVTDDEVKAFSQKAMLNYVNPRISISEWEYSPIADKIAWFKRYGIDEGTEAEDVFQEIKKKSEFSEDITDYEARNIMIILDEFKNLGYQGYYPINIAYDVNDRVVAQIEENKSGLFGVRVSMEPIRYYPQGTTASHILGYMGKIAQEEEVKKYIDEKGYLPGYLIGKTGVEQNFEDYLKGEDGSKRVEVDSMGNVISSIEESDTVPGDTLYLTIDADLQSVMEDSLVKALSQIQRGGVFESEWGNYNYAKSYPFATSGSAVAIDTKTGEVLAMANYPSYDPNLFATGISSEDWENLMPEDEDDPLAARPLYNTAMQTAVQPGSTFKMITGMAAMEVGISPKKTIYDYGVVELGDTQFGCWIWNSSRGSHGPTDLYHALAESCNYYFYSVALGRIPKTGEALAGKAGVDEIMKVAEEFGLGEKTGVEIPGEVSRGVPSSSTKTESIKALLRNFLNRDIESYYAEGKKFDSEDKVKIVNEIVSWTEYEKPLSKAEVVKRLSKLGIDGEKTLPGNGEDLGDTIKYTYLNQSQWNEADDMNISIGQGENSYTPLQMANYIATLANGGTRNKVSVIDKIDSYDSTKTSYIPEKSSEKVNLKDMSSIEEVGKGMYQGSTEGLVRGMFGNFPVKVAAKTGTAQKGGVNPITGGGYDNYSWTTAYAPYEEGNPDASRIAVAVMISQGGEGGYSTPIAREVIAEYLKLGKEHQSESFDIDNKLAR